MRYDAFVAFFRNNPLYQKSHKEAALANQTEDSLMSNGHIVTFSLLFGT